MARYAKLVNVDHFRPTQIGGMNFVQGIPVLLPDGPFVDILKTQNPNHIVECDKDGKIMGKMPKPPIVEPVVRAVRTARDEENAKDNTRRIQDAERDKVLEDSIAPYPSAIGADAVDPGALDIEVPAFQPPDHPEQDDEIRDGDVIETIVEPERGADGHILDVQVPKKRRRGGKK